MSETTKEVATLTIRNTKYPVSLRVYDRGTGAPSSTFVLEGLKSNDRYSREISADTLEDLYAKGMLAAKTKRVMIDLPVMQIDWRRSRHATKRVWRSGKIVGRHAGTSNLIVQWDGEKPEQDTRN